MAVKTPLPFPSPTERRGDDDVVEECNESVGCLYLNLAFWGASNADNLLAKPQRDFVSQWSSDPRQDILES